MVGGSDGRGVPLLAPRRRHCKKSASRLSCPFQAPEAIAAFRDAAAAARSSYVDIAAGLPASATSHCSRPSCTNRHWGGIPSTHWKIPQHAGDFSQGLGKGTHSPFSIALTRLLLMAPSGGMLPVLLEAPAAACPSTAPSELRCAPEPPRLMPRLSLVLVLWCMLPLGASLEWLGVGSLLELPAPGAEALLLGAFWQPFREAGRPGAGSDWAVRGPRAVADMLLGAAAASEAAAGGAAGVGAPLADSRSMVKWKVEPSPSRDSAHTLPPISCASCLEMASPRPAKARRAAS